MQSSQESSIDLESQLARDIGEYFHDPLGHAYYSYPWGKEGTDLEHEKGPKEWQKEVLSTIGDHLSNSETRFNPLQIAISSGNGPGKSALISMVTKWALDTFPDTRVVITANTEPQMRTKTIPEVMKWCNLAINKDWYNYTATSIASNQDKHDKSWRCDFLPWNESKPESFAGLHNKNKRLVIIMDEASAIADNIWDYVEGCLTDADTEMIWIVCGNPTRANGRFRECFRKFSKLWKKWKIDTRTVEGVNQDKINKWLETYGEDSDFFKVRVRGEFPSASMYQFISAKILDRARGRELQRHQYDFAPKIITCDPAWTGDDDLVIGFRQGLYFKVLEKIPKNDNDVFIANKIARYEDEEKADAVFIDGAYGTGIVSVGQSQNRDWHIVWFGEQSSRADCHNKRAEMIVLTKEWLEQGGCIPDDDDLYEEACAIDLVEDLAGKFKFIPKKEIRELIGRSTGSFDVLMLSFAMPVTKKLITNNHLDEYDDENYAEGYDPLADY